MIMFWDRKEIFVGNALQEFNKVRSKLATNQVKYEYKIVDATSPTYFGSNRARLGTYGLNMDYTKIYYIYVHKNEYDKVQALLRY